jgi:chemotaxis protein MotB
MSRSPHHMEQHEEGDEGWIVSYADLVTLMLGFFILMYKVVADEGSVKKLEKQIGDALLGNKRPSMEQVLEEASEERKARAFQLLVTMLDLGDSAENAVGNIERKYAEAGSAEAFEKILDQEMSPKAKQQLQVLKAGPLQKDVALRLVIPSDTTFRSGEADVNSLTRDNLAELARGLLPMDDLIEVEITGHTDEQPTRAGGKWASNWELSAARAAAVAAILRQQGLSGEKLKIAGVAHFQPLVPFQGLSGESLLEARSRNRRIEIAIKRKRPVQKQDKDADKVKP